MCSNLQRGAERASLPQAGLRALRPCAGRGGKRNFRALLGNFRARDVSLHVEYIVIRDIARNQPAGVTIWPLGGSNTGIPNRSEEDTNDCGLASVVPRFVGGWFGRHHFYRWLQKETRCDNSAAYSRSRAGASSTDCFAFRRPDF